MSKFTVHDDETVIRGRLSIPLSGATLEDIRDALDHVIATGAKLAEGRPGVTMSAKKPFTIDFSWESVRTTPWMPNLPALPDLALPEPMPTYPPFSPYTYPTAGVSSMVSAEDQPKVTINNFNVNTAQEQPEPVAETAEEVAKKADEEKPAKPAKRKAKPRSYEPAPEVAETPFVPTSPGEKLPELDISLGHRMINHLPSGTYYVAAGADLSMDAVKVLVARLHTAKRSLLNRTGVEVLVGTKRRREHNALEVEILRPEPQAAAA